MTAQIRLLGALSPERQLSMENTIARMEALQQQIYSDITTLGRAGVDVAALQMELNELTGEIVSLNAAIATADDAMTGWEHHAGAIEAALTDLLNKTVRMRQSAAERGQLLGLSWGLGSAVAVAGISWWVWSRRKGRRR